MIEISILKYVKSLSHFSWSIGFIHIVGKIVTINRKSARAIGSGNKTRYEINGARSIERVVTSDNTIGMFALER